MYLSSPNFSAFQAGYADFLTKYKAKVGKEPISAFHAHAYDATNILFAAIEKVAVKASDGSLSIGRKGPPRRDLRDQGLPGHHRRAELLPDRRLRRSAHRDVPDHRARNRWQVAAGEAGLAVPRSTSAAASNH